MLRALRHAIHGVARPPHRLICGYLGPLLIVGFVAGCETAAPWVDPLAVVQPQEPAESLGGDRATTPPEKDRTTVVCTEAPLNSFSMFTHAPQTSYVVDGTGIANGTGFACPHPPCAIERGSDTKQGTVTVHVDLRMYADTSVLDEPIVTVTGFLKGSSAAEVSTKTFGPLASISVTEVEHDVAITVDTSDFGDIENATLSWTSKAKRLNSNASQNFSAECVCCEEACWVENGVQKCICELFGDPFRGCPKYP